MQPYETLESRLSTWSGMENLVACSSGTAALHLALECLNLPMGSRVIVPDYTMIACARAVSMAGLTPVFVDCDSRLLMDLELLDDALSREHASCIMAVHVYGRRLDMDGVAELAAKNECAVVEDLAEGHGISPHPFTDAACWSFYQNKIVAGEEGGAVGFLESESADLARSLRSLGFTKDHDYYHAARGCNYRLANLLAAPILDSLDKYPINVEYRRTIEGWYNELCPSQWRMPKRDVVWVYDIRLPELRWIPKVRYQMIERLNRAGIQARQGFKPMTKQWEYSECESVDLGNSGVAGSEVIYLPVQPGITTKEKVAMSICIIQEVLRSAIQ